MKIAKIIYLSALPVFLSLMMIFSFVHVFNGGNKGQASEPFLDNAQKYAQTLYEASNGNLSEVVTSQNDSQYVSTALNKLLATTTGIGIKQGSYSYKSIYDEETNEYLYMIPQVTYNMHTFQDSTTVPVTNSFSFEYTVTAEKQIEYQKANGGVSDLEIAIGRKVKNTVVVVPGQKTKDGLNGDAVLFTVHMDSPKLTSSAIDASTMGVALAQITDLFNYENNNASNAGRRAKYENDIVFLFTDARYDSSFGVHSFFDEFYGFYQVLGGTTAEPEVADIVSRIKLAINFDSLGTSGSAMLLQTSCNNSALVREYAKAMGGTVSSSFVSDIYSGYASDFAAFGELNSLNLVTFGNLGAYATANDSIDSISDSVFEKKAGLVTRSVSHFGSLDLASLNSESDSVYLSFLGMFTVAYPEWASYVFGALTLLLMGGIVALNIIKKKFSFKTLGRAVAVQLISLTATVASMFLAYFLMAVILSGFGLFTIQSIVSYVYANAGILIGYILFATVILTLFYTLTRKLLSKDKPLTALNLVRGGVALFSAVAVILSFASPSLAAMFIIPAMLFLAVMLATMLIKKFDLSKLFLYLIPFAIALAFVIPTVALLALTVRSVLMPIILLPVFVLLLTVSPYVLMLIKPLNALAKRMPKRTIRVQKMVVERTEDKAKPGKFSEKEVKKIVKEKIEWRYRHGAGVAAISVISVIIIMACSAFSVPFGANVYVNSSAKQPFNQYVSNIYEDSLLLKWTGSGVSSAKPEVTLEVHDKAAFKYFNSTLNGYGWDSGINAYVKALNVSSMEAPALSTNGNVFSITPAPFIGQRGIVEVYLSDISNVSKINVYDGSTLKNKISVSGTDSLTLRFPLDNSAFARIDLDFEFKTAVASEIDVEYKQYIWDVLSGNNLINAASVIGESEIAADISTLINYFKNDKDASSAIRFGVVYTLSETITF